MYQLRTRSRQRDHIIHNDQVHYLLVINPLRVDQNRDRTSLLLVSKQCLRSALLLLEANSYGGEVQGEPQEETHSLQDLTLRSHGMEAIRFCQESV